MIVRAARDADHSAIWAVLEPIIRAGDTYTLDRDLTMDQALAYWCGPGMSVSVAEDAGQVVGTAYLRRNQGGGGAHVCNAGFATSPRARGRGVARALLDHALAMARAAGYAAMQFNFVVSTNTRAIAIWEGAGFATVGRLPDAFDHPGLGRVDALVMYKTL